MRRPAKGENEAARRPRQATILPFLEPLEDRFLPSVSSLPALDPSTYDPAHVLVRLSDLGVAAGEQLAPGVTVSQRYELVPGLYKIDLAKTIEPIYHGCHLLLAAKVNRCQALERIRRKITD